MNFRPSAHVAPVRSVGTRHAIAFRSGVHVALFCLLCLCAARAQSSTAVARSVPAPEEVLGFHPGEDRKLASWNQVIEYFRRLAATSARVRFEELGKSTMGQPFVMAIISAPENLARLDEFRRIQQQLADPRLLGRDDQTRDRAAEELIKRGRAVVLITCAIHSTEVGSYLSSMLIAHRLAASNEPEVLETLRNTIILLVPSLNPDGVDIVKDWYDRTLGTPYEGSNPPILYHKYAGHDNNRDWYAFTQIETRLTVDKIHNVWHPQIVHDIHQQSPYGSRLFLPPYMAPVEPNVPRQIVEGYTELGLFVARRMLEAGFRGITWNSSYDAWTPARAYSHYHGGVRILSETASARLASPLTVKFEELRSRDGYDPQKPSDNFPVVWPGGEWRLRDITNYMTTAAFELLHHAALNREGWLRRFYEIGKEAIRERKAGELFAFVIPPAPERSAQAHRTEVLLDTLRRGGVEIERASSFVADGTRYPNGTMVIRLAQPYGSFAKALLERQKYPDLRDAAGRPMQPYDVTAHTLSLLMGVEVRPVFHPFQYFARKESQRAPTPIKVNTRARVALYRSHVPSMDEGWTRWVLEQHGVSYASLVDQGVRAGSLRAKFDAIIIPDHSPRAIFEGHRPGTMPPEYVGGLGEEGVRQLREFVMQGGTLICLNRASDFAIEKLGLPVRDVTEGTKREEFYVPGSILRVTLDTTHPLARELGRETIVWAEDSPAFEVLSDRARIIARYPTDGELLLSGWLLGEQKIRGRAALVEVRLGRGSVYLFGFRPQYRGQSLATYPLLFNAIAASADGRS